MSEQQPEPCLGAQKRGLGRRGITIIMLAIVLVFVITMVVLGVSPDVAGGIGVTVLAACAKAAGGRPDAKE
jgi:hypothetical protein